MAGSASRRLRLIISLLGLASVAVAAADWFVADDAPILLGFVVLSLMCGRFVPRRLTVAATALLSILCLVGAWAPFNAGPALDVVGLRVATVLIMWLSLKLVVGGRVDINNAQIDFGTVGRFTPIGLFLCDPAGRLVFANRRLCELTGWTEAEMHGDGWARLIHPEDRDGMVASWVASVQSLEEYQRDFRVVTPGGRTVWMSSRAAPVRCGKRVVGWIGGLTDITERKQAEVALLESETRFRRLFESDIVGVAVSDLDGAVTEANDAYLRLTGRNRDELPLDWRSITPPDQLAGDDLAVDAIRKHGAAPPWRKDYVRPDGERVPALVAIAGLGDARTLCLALDLRPLREAEQALRFTQIALDRAPEAVFWLEPDGAFCYVNDAACESLGYSRDELLTMHVRDIATHALSDAEWHEFIASFQPNEVRTLVRGHRRRDGSTFPVEVIASPVEYEGRRVICAFARDLREQVAAQRAIEQGRDQLRLSIQIAKLNPWEMDLEEGRITYVFEDSDATPWMETVDGLVGRVHPADRPILRQRLDELSDGAAHLDVEFRDVTDGEVSWRRALGRTEFDDAGKPIRVLGVTQDISDSKRTLQALARSEENYRVIFDSVSDAVFVHDGETGKILDVNAQMCEMYGYTREEVLELPAGSMSADQTPEKLEDARRKMARAIAGEPQLFEWQGKRKTGEAFWTEVSLRAARIEDTLRVLAIVRDISERKQSEMALRRSEQRWRSLWENAPDIITELDLDGKIVAVNRMPGEGPADAGANAFEYLDDENEAILRETIENVMTSGVPQTCMVSSTAVADHETFYTCRVFPHHDADERVGVVVISTDVTEQRRAEVDRRSLEQHLLQTQKMEAIGQLAGGVAHDINNLLMVIGSNLQLVCDEIASESGREAVDGMRHAVEQASDVTGALLAFSHRQPVERHAIDLAAIAAQSVRLLKRSMPATIDVKLETDEDAPPAWILADPTQVQQIVMNLVINARDAMPSGGTIRVRVALDEDFGDDDEAYLAKLTVADEGDGIPADVQQRIYEPYFTTKPRGRGTGLGLAIVHGLVERHDGHIVFETEQGKGTTFTIGFPTIEAPAWSEPIEPMVGPTTRGVALLVESDVVVRGVLSSMLADLDHAVLLAAGADAVERLYERHGSEVTLVLVPSRIESTSGLDLVASLRERGYRAAAIVTVGDQDDFDVSPGEGTALLRRPFMAADLAGTLQELHGALAART